MPYLSEYLNRHGYFSLNYTGLVSHLDFPGGTRDKKLTCQCRKCKGGGLIPRSGRSPGGGIDSPLQYSYLEYPMDREAWWDIPHGATESDMTQHTD